MIIVKLAVEFGVYLYCNCNVRRNAPWNSITFLGKYNLRTSLATRLHMDRQHFIFVAFSVIRWNNFSKLLNYPSKLGTFEGIIFWFNRDNSQAEVKFTGGQGYIGPGIFFMGAARLLFNNFQKFGNVVYKQYFFNSTITSPPLYV